MEDVNKKLVEALDAKTKAQRMKSHYKISCSKMEKVNPFLSYDDQISKLKNRIAILEVEKIEMEDRLKNLLILKL